MKGNNPMYAAGGTAIPPVQPPGRKVFQLGAAAGRNRAMTASEIEGVTTVSYTHLTLPTICSV